MGKVTVIVEVDGVPTQDLYKQVLEFCSPMAETLEDDLNGDMGYGLGPGAVGVYVVPSDEG